MSRRELVAELAARALAIRRLHPTRIAIDGVDAAGKTTLAGELARAIEAAGRQVVTAGVDSFHHPAAIRKTRGELSAEGYYRDSFDHNRLIEVLLAPLGPGGSREFRTAVFDYRTDRPVDAEVETAAPDALLVFEGVFLHCPKLRDYWDWSIFVDASFEVTLPRAERRDLGGDVERLRERYRRRYIPGQQLYLAECRPRERADVVVGNDDPTAPTLA